MPTNPENRERMREMTNATKQPSYKIHVLIFVDYDKCVEEPGICLNGATCERHWTSAKCLCATRFQGKDVTHVHLVTIGNSCGKKSWIY